MAFSRLTRRSFQALFDVIHGSATVDPADTAAAADSQIAVTVTDAAVGDMVLFFPGVAITSGVTVQATVSATNTVTITFDNETGDHVNLASSTWYFVLLRPSSTLKNPN